MPVSFLEYRQLQELFDNSLNWDWDYISDTIASAFFSINGVDYEVDFMYGSLYDSWTLDFYPSNTEADTDAIINDYKANIVFATVIDIAYNFVEKFSPEKLTFEGAKGELQRGVFYKKLIKRYMPDNYSVSIREDEQAVTFIITKVE